MTNYWNRFDDCKPGEIIWHLDAALVSNKVTALIFLSKSCYYNCLRVLDRDQAYNINIGFLYRTYEELQKEIEKRNKT